MNKSFQPYLKITHVIIVAIMWSTAAMAQLSPANYKHEVSFNATSLLQNIFAITPSVGDIEPYTVQYRRVNWETNWATRAALGLDFDIGSSQGSFSPQRESSDSNFRLRVGREKRIPLNEKLYFVLGLDAFGQIDRQKVKSNTNPVTTTVELQYNTGISPVFGLTLKFAKRATLSVETAFNTYYQFRRSETETNNGQPPTIFINRSVNTSIDQPFGLYFGFIF